MRTAIILIGFLTVWAKFDARADWPQYRADAARSGYTAEPLSDTLALQWIYEARHAPRPAWSGEDTRMPFDHAYHTVIADGLLFFGSSADCKIYALNAVTGEERWAFFTDAPVRFAPAVWNDRVFAVSDDGCLYCLSAKEGRLLWKIRGGPRNEMVLGNSRMIARWPARGGPVVADGVVYFGAGIWPSEGIYLYAIDAETGRKLWVEDSAGGLEMAQPHGTAWAKSGITAQGYLAVSGDTLFVPTGRAVPAAFSKADGAFRYFHLQRNQKRGGPGVALLEPYFFNAGYLYDIGSGELTAELPASALVAGPEYIVCAEKDKLIALDRKLPVFERDAVNAKGRPIKKKQVSAPVWMIDMPGLADPDLIMAGSKVVAGTADGRVIVADIRSKKIVWSTNVAGRPLGLAVAGERLYVSTDQGHIYCFAGSKTKNPVIWKPADAASPDLGNGTYAAAAAEIVRTAKTVAGYCLDLDCLDAGLAYELARRTDLHIYAISPDDRAVQTAREQLDAAGLYGVRVTVHLGDPAATPYPRYFANLVVSGRSVKDGADIASEAEMLRLRRPYGGLACLGRPGDMTLRAGGPIPGAGGWTHQYADPSNTSVSRDEVVKAPLEMLWFTDSDLDMPSRHGHGPPPLVSKGRLFVEGYHALRAVDAYNGRKLWEYGLPDILRPYDQEHALGATATGSNFCIGDDAVYIGTGRHCLRIDAATGGLLATFDTAAPADGEAGTWGYLAYVDGTLFGTVANTEHLVRTAYKEADMHGLYSESSFFFALDARTGKPKWGYQPTHSIRHNAIAIAGGRVYLIDRPLDEVDRADFDLDLARRRGETTPSRPAAQQGIPELVALDAATGAVLWRNRIDIYGTLLAVSTEHDILVMTYQHTRDKLESEVGGRMSAFRASDGTRLWDAITFPQAKPKPSSRLLLNGGTIYLEPNAFDLFTGRQLDFTLERSYGCGIMAGSKNLLVYRSATLGYLDLLKDNGTENYGGIRPGCWINAIPADGLVLMPDVTSGCTCSYQTRAWIALAPCN